MDRGAAQCGCSSGVEHFLAKEDVEGSNPFARSNSRSSGRPRPDGTVDATEERMALRCLFVSQTTTAWGNPPTNTNRSETIMKKTVISAVSALVLMAASQHALAAGGSGGDGGSLPVIRGGRGADGGGLPGLPGGRGGEGGTVSGYWGWRGGRGMSGPAPSLPNIASDEQLAAYCIELMFTGRATSSDGYKPSDCEKLFAALAASGFDASASPTDDGQAAGPKRDGADGASIAGGVGGRGGRAGAGPGGGRGGAGGAGIGGGIGGKGGAGGAGY